MIIMLGTNDARPLYWDKLEERDTDFEGTPSQEFRRQGYLELIRELRGLAGLDSAPEILVATPPPIYPEKAAEKRPEDLAIRRDNLVDDVIPLIREVAEEAEGGAGGRARPHVGVGRVGRPHARRRALQRRGVQEDVWSVRSGSDGGLRSFDRLMMAFTLRMCVDKKRLSESYLSATACESSPIKNQTRPRKINKAIACSG